MALSRASERIRPRLCERGRDRIVLSTDAAPLAETESVPTLPPPLLPVDTGGVVAFSTTTAPVAPAFLPLRLLFRALPPARERLGVVPLDCAAPPPLPELEFFRADLELPLRC